MFAWIDFLINCTQFRFIRMKFVLLLAAMAMCAYAAPHGLFVPAPKDE